AAAPAPESAAADEPLAPLGGPLASNDNRQLDDGAAAPASAPEMVEAPADAEPSAAEAVGADEDGLAENNEVESPVAGDAAARVDAVEAPATSDGETA